MILQPCVNVGLSLAFGAQIAMQHGRVVAALTRAEEMEREETTTVQTLQTVRQKGRLLCVFIGHHPICLRLCSTIKAFTSCVTALPLRQKNSLHVRLQLSPRYCYFWFSDRDRDRRGAAFKLCHPRV